MTKAIAIPKLSRNIPPLEVVERVEIHEGTGEKVKVTNYKRGAAKLVSRTYTGFAAFEPEPPARTLLENYRDRIQERLKVLGLPSDLNPFWTELEDGSWVEVSDPKNGGETCINWYYRVLRLTEVLTEGRALAEHLEDINSLLSLKLDEAHLRTVLGCMQSRVNLTLWGPLNELASDGMVARRSRAAGPTTRKERSEQKRQIVRELAKEFWLKNSELVGDAGNTAGNIVDLVNTELKARGLSPLAEKTVSDYIREGLHKNLF